MNKLWRIVYRFEVLTDSPMHHEYLSLENINYEVTQGGHASGVFLDPEVEEVTPERMATLLIAQGSDPSFLLGEDES